MKLRSAAIGKKIVGRVKAIQFEDGEAIVEFRRRKPMLSGTKKKISRALKRLRKNPVFVVGSTLAAGSVIPITKAYLKHQNRVLKKEIADQAYADRQARDGAARQRHRDDLRDLQRMHDLAYPKP